MVHALSIIQRSSLSIATSVLPGVLIYSTYYISFVRVLTIFANLYNFLTVWHSNALTVRTELCSLILTVNCCKTEKLLTVVQSYSSFWGTAKFTVKYSLTTSRVHSSFSNYWMSRNLFERWYYAGTVFLQFCKLHVTGAENRKLYVYRRLLAREQSYRLDTVSTLPASITYLITGRRNVSYYKIGTKCGIFSSLYYCSTYNIVKVLFLLFSFYFFFNFSNLSIIST